MTLGSIQFVYHIDGDGANLVDSLNMINFAAGFELAEGGWIQQVPAGDNVTLIETLTFRVQATTQDQLATYLQVLDDWIRRVDYFKDQTIQTAVWLRVQVTDESQPRQALVTSMQYAVSDSAYGQMWGNNKTIPTLTIVLERSAFWEEITSHVTEDISESSIGGKGLISDFTTGDPLIMTGDASARILLAQFLAIGGGFVNIWAGMRLSRNGVLSNFVPVWSLAGAVYLLTGDTAIVADATAYSGNKIVTDFSGGATLINRARINVADVTANVNDQRGFFTCVARAKMSDTSVSRLRASSGFVSNSYLNTYIVNPRVTVSGTSWKLYNLGSVRLPALDQRFPTENFIMAVSGVSLDAELVSGTGNLELDCLILIPSSDGRLNINADASLGVINHRTNPDYSGVSYGTTMQKISYSQSGWGIPSNNESPLLVFASQSTSSVLTYNLSVQLTYIKRWRILRGNE